MPWSERQFQKPGEGIRFGDSRRATAHRLSLIAGDVEDEGAALISRFNTPSRLLLRTLLQESERRVEDERP